MIEARLKDNNQSSKYINKSEISTVQIKYGGYSDKSILVKMKNGESFEIYYNEKDLKELTSE